MKSKKAKQLTFPFDNPVRVGRHMQAVVRCGRLPAITTMHDIDKIIGPHGDGARDAFDRDISMMDSDDGYDSEGFAGYDDGY